MKLIFAFAVNEDRVFEKKHFGEARNFALYHYENGKIVFKEVIPNRYRAMEENGNHGSAKKGDAIIQLLKGKEVSILVSRQFGKNIQMVNQHFIPVIISDEHPEMVVPVLEKHLNWLKEEQTAKTSGFMLFQIRNGIMKSQITSSR